MGNVYERDKTEGEFNVDISGPSITRDIVPIKGIRMFGCLPSKEFRQLVSLANLQSITKYHHNP